MWLRRFTTEGNRVKSLLDVHVAKRQAVVKCGECRNTLEMFEMYTRTLHMQRRAVRPCVQLLNQRSSRFT
ncbi:hypothetical protein MPTK1_5g08720 [Marchantia polymorpha subsp. ruderalis]|uniref:Uncharacterized protein n=2 Tax=Marchantia polymorpha TaxID=3197 RepID=A0AAF6BGC9_MARPO|nr:hypothetical protein MARPO_0086s0076 [Marchantia polymorpha]BBN11063.1 hypothetical protein Mp_5g08720 [Marchantia polymorpha subsp. ruderalis]|eukprot:PTQ33761.1 hypothetical protein MARPO_0086s0076 [Marchantia polymorpha]